MESLTVTVDGGVIAVVPSSEFCAVLTLCDPFQTTRGPVGVWFERAVMFLATAFAIVRQIPNDAEGGYGCETYAERLTLTDAIALARTLIARAL